MSGRLEYGKNGMSTNPKLLAQGKTRYLRNSFRTDAIDSGKDAINLSFTPPAYLEAFSNLCRLMLISSAGTAFLGWLCDILIHVQKIWALHPKIVTRDEHLTDSRKWRGKRAISKETPQCREEEKVRIRFKAAPY